MNTDTPSPPASAAPAGRTFESLPAQAIWLFRLGNLFWVAALAVAAGIGAVALMSRLGLGLGAAIGLWLALTLGALALGWRLAALSHRATRFLLDDEGFCVRGGVCWRTESHIARSRVQHTDIRRHPLAQKLGLAELVVYTAGTQLAAVSLPGLTLDRARTLRDALLEGHDQRF